LRLGEAFGSLSDVASLYPYLVTRWAGHSATALLVLSAEEKTTLDAMHMARRAIVIPHFIEDRPLLPRPPAAPKASRKTVIMAGFIFKNKGYDIMLEAMSLLPDVELVFVGGPRLGVAGSDTAARLMDLARLKGVAHRMRLTGYLAEGDYQRHLANADLAVCPFEPDKSASGSLSSLIAAGCPILASEIPLIAEYNAVAPGAIATFSPYTPAALAGGIRDALEKPRDQGTRALVELRQRLGIARIYDQHLEIYQRVRAGR
jgi:glycosyltransferase involved in cell wall biosynthesis